MTLKGNTGVMGEGLTPLLREPTPPQEPASVLLSPASLSQAPLAPYFLFLFAITGVLLHSGACLHPRVTQRRREGGSEPKEVPPPEGPPLSSHVQRQSRKEVGHPGRSLQIGAFLKQSQ